MNTLYTVTQPFADRSVGDRIEAHEFDEMHPEHKARCVRVGVSEPRREDGEV